LSQALPRAAAYRCWNSKATTALRAPAPEKANLAAACISLTQDEVDASTPLVPERD
jgi:hypothetical protein